MLLKKIVVQHVKNFEEVFRATGVPATSVFRILTNDFKKRKIYARWIPHCLTAEQKQKRLDVATLLKERFDIEDQAFLYRIVAIDGEVQVPLGQENFDKLNPR